MKRDIEGERIKLKHLFCFSPTEPGTELKSYLQTATEDKQTGQCCTGLLAKKFFLQEQQYNNNNNKNNKIK